MTVYIDVIVPGPWWTTLTYKYQSSLMVGVRVKVPMGKTERTGFVDSVLPDNQISDFEIKRAKEIISVVDAYPVIPSDLLELARWAGEKFFCGTGQALSAMLPKQFLNGENVTEDILESSKKAINTTEKPAKSSEADLVFRAEFFRRKERYFEIIEKSGSSLMIFPELSQAEEFYNDLPVTLSQKALLWPVTGGKKLWKSWKDVLGGNYSIIVASPAGVFAPHPLFESFLIEDESNPAYRMCMSPYLNLRSILSKRSRISASRLVMGGRLPSSRIYRVFQPECRDVPDRKRIHLVDIKNAPKPKVPGVEAPFRISEKVLEETDRSIRNKRLAIWILDRKGYAGQIFCESCGYILSCEKCGGFLTWDAGRETLLCTSCRDSISLPETCPHCRGNLLTGKRPGLEALLELSKKILPGNINLQMWHAGFPSGKKERKIAISKLGDKGLVIGSRNALSLMDNLDTGTVCWLDGDVEAGKSFYNSRSSAYSMVWESFWRGKGYMDRQVVIQSRVPGISWQKTLLSGWDYFWAMELEERLQFEVPPFCFMIEVYPPAKIKKQLEEKLSGKGYEVFEIPEFPGAIWTRVTGLKKLREDLMSFYQISESKSGFPQLRVWMD